MLRLNDVRKNLVMRDITELGERKVIEIILQALDIMPNRPVSLGDDVSAVEINCEKLAVIKTDMLVGKTDIPPGMSLFQAARKSVVMNISDMAAKGAKPLAVLASLGLPRNLTEEDVRQIGRGLNEGAREYGSYVLGGDTNESSDLIISCSVLGFCNKGAFIRRSGAKAGDVVAATGTFGKTTCGLKILLDNLTVSKEVRDVLVDPVLMPRARLREGLALAKSGALTSSIDSSDGLAWSLYELSKMSGVGFLIENVPLAPEVTVFAREQDLNPLDLALYGGEEYELLVTVKPERWEDVKNIVESFGTPMTAIGKVIEERKIILKTKKGIVPIEPKGWEHFKSR